MLLRSALRRSVTLSRSQQLGKITFRRRAGIFFKFSTQSTDKSTHVPLQSDSFAQYEDTIKQLRSEVNQLKQQIEDSKNRSREKMAQRKRKLGIGIAVLVVIDAVLILAWFFYDDDKKKLATPSSASEGAEAPPAQATVAIPASPPPLLSIFKAPVKLPKSWSGVWTDGSQTIELSSSGKGVVRDDGPDFVVSLAEGSVTNLSPPWMSLELTQKRQFKIDREPNCDSKTGKCTMVLNGRTYSRIAEAIAK